MPRACNPRRTCVYRIFDARGDLLYVGMTSNLGARMARHRRRSWWKNSPRIEVEWFGSRMVARAAEDFAIYHEHPIYNVTRPELGCC